MLIEGVFMIWPCYRRKRKASEAIQKARNVIKDDFEETRRILQ